MRKTRRILLAALILAVAAVGYIYRVQSAQQARKAPVPPKPLAENTQSASKDWVYYKGDGDRPIIEVRAKEMEQVGGESGAVVRLKGVDLRLYKKDGRQYDHVESLSAEFDQTAASLFAEGEVTITLAEHEPVDGQPVNRERLLKIVTSGVHFAAATGKAETDQPARFEFDLGSGTATGATYDPQERDLRLLHDVKLNWLGRDKSRPPIHVEAAGLVYREAESKVHLLEHSVFERQTLKITGGQAEITLDEGAIRFVEAANATGTDHQPKRDLSFAARLLKLTLNERSEIEQVLGEGASRVEVQTPTAATDLAADRLQMNFAIANGTSTLVDALTAGPGTLHNRPKAAVGTERVLHSDVIYAKMRLGGEELEQVDTRAPGTLDLLPLAPGQPKRHLEADRMSLAYAAGNVMETFTATDARTRTERANQPPALTSSKDLVARFDAKSGAMTRLEQTTNFRYDEGPQHATANKGVLDQTTGRIELTSDTPTSRAWDASGQVVARTIVLDQRTGGLTAEGDVVSTREPESKSAKNDTGAGPLMDQSQPLHGKAAKLTISDKNTVIVHEGGAKGKAQVWQGPNRIEGAKVTINRATRKLSAAGDVTSLLADQSAKQPLMTTVHADALDYDDTSRLAHYTGGVKLARPGLDVRSAELRAFLAPAGSAASGLDHLIADGSVTISQTFPGGWRKGASEHGEYFTEGGKVILSGGNPVMTDSVKGSTKGDKLTYTSAADSLVVEGAPQTPAVSRIKRKQ